MKIINTRPQNLSSRDLSSALGGYFLFEDHQFLIIFSRDGSIIHKGKTIKDLLPDHSSWEDFGFFSPVDNERLDFPKKSWMGTLNFEYGNETEYLDCSINPYPAENPNCYILTGALSTDRVKLEVVAHKQAEYLDLMADPIVVFAEDGTVVFKNNSALSLFGHLSLNWTMVFGRHLDIKEVEHSPLLSWERGGKYFTSNFKRANGEVVSITRDVTDIRRIDQARLREEYLRNLQTFSELGAHEINNLFQSLQGLAVNQAISRPIQDQIKMVCDRGGEVGNALLSFTDSFSPHDGYFHFFHSFRLIAGFHNIANGNLLTIDADKIPSEGTTFSNFAVFTAALHALLGHLSVIDEAPAVEFISDEERLSIKVKNVRLPFPLPEEVSKRFRAINLELVATGTVFYLYAHHYSQGEEAKKDPLSGYKIVLVDDDTMVLKSTSKLLQAFGASVTEYSKPAEALRSLYLSDVDLLITDYSMPEMDGGELLARLREGGSKIPAIIFSGMPPKFLENLPYPTLSKPVKAEMLVSKALEVIKSKR
jgi:CheY-like chemotaxis protein